MMQKFTVPGRLPGYNDLHQNWQKSRRVKQEAMEWVMWSAKAARIKPIQGRCQVDLVCYEPNARRDPDNVISGARKVILDALQRLGVLAGDGRKYVSKAINDRVEVDRKNPRVEVEIKEIEDGQGNA